MKKILCILFVLASGRVRSQTTAGASGPDTILLHPLALSERMTTNLIFPYPIVNVDLGTADVLARRPGRLANVLLLKARLSQFRATNISVYVGDGKLYPFEVHYEDSPAVVNLFYGRTGLQGPRLWQPINGLPNPAELRIDADAILQAPAFLNVHGSDGRVRLTLKSLYLKDSLLWLSLSGGNRSLIDFIPEWLKFSIVDKRQTRRTAVQSIGLDPVYLSPMDNLRGNGGSQLGAAFFPFVLGHGKRLLIEWVEKGNGRRVQVRIGRKTLLRTKRFFSHD